MPGMIVASEPLAVEEGWRVLVEGGNAVDAAVTAALVQGVVNPQMCGIGGYTLLNLFVPGKGGQGLSQIHDAPALAGSAVRPDMWVNEVIRPNPDGWGYFLKNGVNTVGYTAICTPGAVRGLTEMLSNWGTISWKRALQPAIRIAREGYMVSAAVDNYWKERARYPEAYSFIDIIRSNAEASRIYLTAEGKSLDKGAALRNPDYAATLTRLANDGPEDFYTGSLGEIISRDLDKNGSFVTISDLENYQARSGDPIATTYRGFRVETVPPPHGGATLLAILNILEHFDLRSMGHNSPDYIYTIAMAMKAGFADRNPHLGDPSFVNVPLEWMISSERARYWYEEIRSGGPIEVVFAPSEPPETTHLSVVDSGGNCVALTHSLGTSSGVITPGLGFMYNNSMVNFHPVPGHPNSIAAGKGRTTGMTPTIIYRKDQPILVIGAPGATRIITSLVQVIVNVIDFGMPVERAVLAARMDCQGDLIRCQARIPGHVCAEVEKRHPVRRMPESHGGLGLVHAIAIDPESGVLSGAADFGSGGMALEVE
ncbi:MAG: gamma-glutamyltransferase [Spirochaetales bacterium]|nr:gamma-glutamyltransferase [Spirochaetales bacterium]